MTDSRPDTPSTNKGSCRPLQTLRTVNTETRPAIVKTCAWGLWICYIYYIYGTQTNLKVGYHSVNPIFETCSLSWIKNSDHRLERPIVNVDALQSPTISFSLNCLCKGQYKSMLSVWH